MARRTPSPFKVGDAFGFVVETHGITLPPIIMVQWTMAHCKGNKSWSDPFSTKP